MNILIISLYSNSHIGHLLAGVYLLDCFGRACMHVHAQDVQLPAWPHMWASITAQAARSCCASMCWCACAYLVGCVGGTQCSTNRQACDSLHAKLCSYLSSTQDRGVHNIPTSTDYHWSPCTVPPLFATTALHWHMCCACWLGD